MSNPSNSSPTGAPEQVYFKSVVDNAHDPHQDGSYLKFNPTWHVEFSDWKAQNILKLLRKHNINPKTVCEVGCGAGEVLRILQQKLDPDCKMWGYDVAHHAIELAKTRENDRLKFAVEDFGTLTTPRYDLLLILEVVDHIEDYMGFLRMLKTRAEYKLFSISLDICVQTAMRKGAFLRRRVAHSHLHHFTKEIALRVLEETGYEVVDYFLPHRSVNNTALSKLSSPVRSLAFKLSPELTTRFLGGSIMILAK